MQGNQFTCTTGLNQLPTKSRRPHSPNIKMISAKNGKIQLREQKKVRGEFIFFSHELY